MPMQNTLTLPVNHSGPVKNEFSSSFAVSEQDKLNFLIEELLEAGKEKSCMELLRHLASADSAEEEACCRELLTLLMAQNEVSCQLFSADSPLSESVSDIALNA